MQKVQDKLLRLDGRFIALANLEFLC
jgi:hypothetical protein